MELPVALIPLSPLFIYDANSFKYWNWGFKRIEGYDLPSFKRYLGRNEKGLKDSGQYCLTFFSTKTFFPVNEPIEPFCEDDKGCFTRSKLIYIVQPIISVICSVVIDVTLPRSKDFYYYYFFFSFLIYSATRAGGMKYECHINECVRGYSAIKVT